MSEGAFLLGNGQVHHLVETPAVPDAKFKRGDVVRVRRNRRVGHIPPELIVLAAVPIGFSPDDALADLVGEPRSFMKQVGARVITYILCCEGDERPYRCRELDLLPSGKEPVEIGTVTRALDAQGEK